jgi:hypothetical protein
MLKESSSESAYFRANHLAWELAMVLPADLYRTITSAVRSPSEHTNPLTVIVDIRRNITFGVDDNLSTENIVMHAPGAGKPRKHPITN